MPTSIFLFTPPVWAATVLGDVSGFNFLISIHAARVGSDGTASARVLVRISIHATRVGSDLALWDEHKSEIISIHATRVGSDRPS